MIISPQAGCFSTLLSASDEGRPGRGASPLGPHLNRWMLWEEKIFGEEKTTHHVSWHKARWSTLLLILFSGHCSTPSTLLWKCPHEVTTHNHYQYLVRWQMCRARGNLVSQKMECCIFFHLYLNCIALLCFLFLLQGWPTDCSWRKQGEWAALNFAFSASCIRLITLHSIASEFIYRR